MSMLKRYRMRQRLTLLGLQVKVPRRKKIKRRLMTQRNRQMTAKRRLTIQRKRLMARKRMMETILKRMVEIMETSQTAKMRMWLSNQLQSTTTLARLHGSLRRED